MKNLNIKYLAAAMFWLAFSACDTEDDLRQDIIDSTPNPFQPTSPPTVSGGEADITNYVAIGASITAGMMDAALYNNGQKFSYPNLLAAQLSQASGQNFVQPNINSDRGFNVNFNDISQARNVATFGRLALDVAAQRPDVLFIPGDVITDYSGPTPVHNYGVPGARVVDLGFNGYGEANVFFGRFDTSGTTSILQDALAAGGTFHTLWAGGNDILGWVSGGGVGPDGDVTPGAELNPSALTGTATFQAAFNGVLSAVAANSKVAVLNLPNILATPLLQAVPYNAIPLDDATATQLNGAFGGLNAALDGLAANQLITQAEADARKVVYSAGANSILAVDDVLENLGPKFDILVGAGAISAEQRAALEPYVQSRPLTANDFVLLSAGLVLNTLADPSNPQSLIGIVVPIADRLILQADEVVRAATRLATFNGIIATEVAANDNAILVDVHTVFNNVTAAHSTGGFEVDGIMVTADFAPTGVFSTDAIHPNPRGQGLIVNEIIRSMNAGFGASIPEVSVSNLPGVVLK
ncbi:MAG: hypothetical protein RJQ09_00990 [Cyclobacteriaceae bacterium]